MSRGAPSAFDAATLRFEYKYPVRAPEYERLRAALRPFVVPDPRGEHGARGRYLVRSLYYDTWDFLAYQEKQAGVPDRVKLRLRSYWMERSAARFVNLEIKSRYGARVGKRVERISLEESDELIERRTVRARRSPLIDEFRRLLLLRAQRPCLLVDYRREAWLPRDGSDTRVTFDHELRFRRARELFPHPAGRGVPGLPQAIVLEVKVREAQPPWLERLVRDFELRSVPNSKYAQAVEQTQPGLVYR